jgi:hypothetical protein
MRECPPEIEPFSRGKGLMAHEKLDLQQQLGKDH